MIGKLSYYLAKFNRLFAVAALLLVLSMVYNTTIPEIESDLAGYNVDDNPYDSAGLRMAEIFGSQNIVQVMVRPEGSNAGILFGGLQDVGDEIMRIFPGSRVESIDRAKRLLYRKVAGESTVQNILAAAIDIPLVSSLVSRDTASFLMVVFIEDTDNFDPAILDSITDQKYSGIESMLTVSRFHIQRDIEKSIARDYMVLLPAILVFFPAYLLLTYRSFPAVFICMVNVGFSFVSVLWFLSLFKVSINQITAPAIPIVAILSLSGSIHLLTGYLHEPGINGITMRVRKTLARYMLPTLLSSLTTAIAFGSFLLSDSHYLRQFGLVTSCSIITVFILVYTITPFSLRLTGNAKIRVITESFTGKLESLIMRHNNAIAIVFLSLTIISVFLVPGIRFHADLESYIPKNTRISNNIKTINEAFHSLAEIDMLIEINPDNTEGNGSGASRREMISLVRDMAGTIAEYPEVSSVSSLADQLDFERQHAIPGFPSIIFSRSRNPFVSADQQKYAINIKLNNSEEIRNIASRLAGDFSRYEPRFTYSIYSDFLFFNFINSSMTASLLRSLLLSSVLIIFILFMLSRNFTFTIISILANLVPLGFLVMIFAIGGIDLNMTTSISLVVCLGLVVDDTIHILYRRVRLASPVGELGFGILTTSIILTGGFLSFLMSQSTPSQIFGVLCAVVFFIAAISDLAVISWLADRWKLRTGNNQPGFNPYNSHHSC